MLDLTHDCTRQIGDCSAIDERSRLLYELLDGIRVGHRHHFLIGGVGSATYDALAPAVTETTDGPFTSHLRHPRCQRPGGVTHR